MGAMYVRQMLWQLHERTGDGTATAAVMFEVIFDEGRRYVAAGGDAMALRRALEEAAPLIQDELSRQTIQIQGKERLAQAAEAICHDPPLAQMLGEIFDIVGEYGRLDIRPGRSRALEREYADGMYWEGGLLSRQALNDRARHRVDLDNAAILISDLAIDDPRDLIPLLTLAVQDGIQSLVLVVKSISDRAVGLLRAETTLEKLQVIPVKTPGAGSTDQAAALEDMALLTGGRPVLTAAGETPASVRSASLGRARRIWADHDYLGLSAGRGDARRLRQHIATLRSAFHSAQEPDIRRKLQQRIGKLMGGSATLWIGGAADTEIKTRQALAERTAQALRGVLREGVVPGGGAALLACRPRLQALRQQSVTMDERAACNILLRALEEPSRTLLANAGYDASETMAAIRRAGPGQGFDVVGGQVADMAQAGILDAAATVKEAVRSAITSAALALTVEVLVRHRRPAQSFEP
jgi:chaperonin GroEL